MVRSEREPLAGAVEVDESLIGGVVPGGKPGRGSSKAVVVIAVEVREPRGCGRLRMRHVPDASGTSLEAFVCDVIAQGAIVRTDGWSGYNGPPHRATCTSAPCSPPRTTPPTSRCPACPASPPS